MVFIVEAQPSDSPHVDAIWRARSERPGSFSSVAVGQLEMVVTTRDGKPTMLTVRGPETHPRHLTYREGGEWFGIRFKLGSFVPSFPVSTLVDSDLNLPNAGDRSFWLHGAAWQFPEFHNADIFVDRLAREGLLIRDPVVEATLRGHRANVSLRTVQRRFLQATGLPHTAIHQIERARQAMILLQHGVSILDVVHDVGYYDQAHLTRALKRWLGQTPAQIAGMSRRAEPSFLYKTMPHLLDHTRDVDRQPIAGGSNDDEKIDRVDVHDAGWRHPTS